MCGRIWAAIGWPHYWLCFLRLGRLCSPAGRPVPCSDLQQITNVNEIETVKAPRLAYANQSNCPSLDHTEILKTSDFSAKKTSKQPSIHPPEPKYTKEVHVKQIKNSQKGKQIKDTTTQTESMAENTAIICNCFTNVNW
ncbi:hypothetical protein PVAP13_1KG103477 [Panicum virgatum]|uniref:Secreted protein n=1 Tax=Panicum virgatum TaxID=38727 RepID=A0A8T0XFP4_PANVG|nr:hypothetical protein PVAP13_1KG103477 [Panicum virgatum]